MRGILANDYGVDLSSIKWVSFEDPHVAEYKDTTERAPAGKTILQMLLDGEIDAALGETSTDPRLRPLFGDPAKRWTEERFASWIEETPDAALVEAVRALPVLAVGDYPDFEQVRATFHD